MKSFLDIALGALNDDDGERWPTEPETPSLPGLPAPESPPPTD